MNNENIILSGGNVSAEINPFGAELKKLIVGGENLMWSGDPKYWGKTSPVLFPSIGNVNIVGKNKTRFYGTEYPMSKHGFARDSLFTAKRPSESSAAFTLLGGEKTREMFPFDFELTITYTLTEKGISAKYVVLNKSEQNMPFCIGAHPALACPISSIGGDFGDYKLIFEKNETVNSPVMNLETRLFESNNRIKRLDNSNVFPLNYRDFDHDCVYFDTISSNSIKLVHSKDDNAGVKIGWSGFTSLGVWTPAEIDAPFICIEPWCGADDFDDENGEFSEKRGVQIAQKGEQKRYELIIEKL